MKQSRNMLKILIETDEKFGVLLFGSSTYMHMPNERFFNTAIIMITVPLANFLPKLEEKIKSE